jgi:hypothetical protein
MSSVIWSRSSCLRFSVALRSSSFARSRSRLTCGFHQSMPRRDSKIADALRLGSTKHPSGPTIGFTDAGPPLMPGMRIPHRPGRAPIATASTGAGSGHHFRRIPGMICSRSRLKSSTHAHASSLSLPGPAFALSGFLPQPVRDCGRSPESGHQPMYVVWVGSPPPAMRTDATPVAGALSITSGSRDAGPGAVAVRDRRRGLLDRRGQRTNRRAGLRAGCERERERGH